MKKLIKLLMVCAMLCPLMAADKKGSTDKKAEPVEKKASEAEKPSDKAVAAAKTLTAAQKTKLMEILNDGDDKSVQTLPGIGPKTSAAIIKGRPYADTLDILKVDGIGESTLVKMVAHAKAGFPEKESKPDSGKTEEGKGKTKKSPKSETTKKKSESAE